MTLDISLTWDSTENWDSPHTFNRATTWSPEVYVTLVTRFQDKPFSVSEY